MSDAICLLSGGVDSAVLAAHVAQHARVHPIYVRIGLAWEAAEQKMVRLLLASPPFAESVQPLAILEFGMRDVYAPTHWAIRGTAPGYDTPDEDVYLTGRNLVLLTKAGVVAASRGIGRIVLGPLADNPFPDATPQFFQSMARTLSLGLNHVIEIDTPFVSMHKHEVIRIGHRLGVPFELTVSCMNPIDGPRPLHCGLCSKCRERRDAFAAAGLADTASYAHASPR